MPSKHRPAPFLLPDPEIPSCRPASAIDSYVLGIIYFTKRWHLLILAYRSFTNIRLLDATKDSNRNVNASSYREIFLRPDSRWPVGMNPKLTCSNDSHVFRLELHPIKKETSIQKHCPKSTNPGNIFKAIMDSTQQTWHRCDVTGKGSFVSLSEVKANGDNSL